MNLKVPLVGLVAVMSLGLAPQVLAAEENPQEVTEATGGTGLVHTHQVPLEEFLFQSRADNRSVQQNFINQVAPSAQSLAGANDMYASVMIAQAIVESGWGKSTLSAAPNYNLFGIKGSYNGQSVTMPTQEYINGQWITVNAKFRKYPSYKESLQDNVNIIRNTSFSPGVYYYAGAWKSNTKSYRDATAYLTGRYATAPNYATALNNMIETYNLTQYDSGVQTVPMHRLYNKNTGEHFYTGSTAEKNGLINMGWTFEGTAWQAPTSSSTKVYRLYNPYTGDHHYTTSSKERNGLTSIGWKYESDCWYSGGNRVLYRLYNPNAKKAGAHHYTLSSSEKDSLVRAGWRYEGIGWNGY